MKHKVIWLGLILLIVPAMLLVSCATSTTISSQTTTSAHISTPTLTQTSTSTQTQITTSIPLTETTTVTTSAGTPQYGGTINLRIDKDYGVWDTFYSGLGASGSSAAQTLGLFYG